MLLANKIRDANGSEYQGGSQNDQGSAGKSYGHWVSSYQLTLETDGHAVNNERCAMSIRFLEHMN